MANWQVISLDTTTPQLRAPGTGDGYSFNSGSTQLGVWTTTGLGVGTASPVAKLDVASANVSINSFGNLSVKTTNSFAVDIGGQITLSGKYDTAGNYANFAAIYGRKENSTDGNYAGYLGFSVLTNGSAAIEKMRLDSSGNLGLGVTPSAWGSNHKAINMAAASTSHLVTTVNPLSTGTNYYNDNTNFLYATTGQLATRYAQNTGQHQWYTAASGTAGTAISFTQAMTLNASGELLVGTTSSDGSRLRVYGSYQTLGDGTYEGLIGKASSLVSGGGTGDFAVRSAANLVFASNGNTERARIDSTGNVVINTAAVATNATNGFLYVPSCAGTPTGTPTTYTGRVPIVVDTTNNKLYFYSGGAWRDAGP